MNNDNIFPNLLPAGHYNEKTVLNINFKLFIDIDKILNSKEKDFILKSSSYNKFFNNEISLFFFMYKLHRQVLEYDNIDELNNNIKEWDYLYLSDSSSLGNSENLFIDTNHNKFFNDFRLKYKDYFNKSYKNDNFHEFFALCCHQFFNNFTDKINIRAIMPQHVGDIEVIKNTTEKSKKDLFIFHVEDILKNNKKLNYEKFNLLYMLNKNYGQSKEDILSIVSRVKIFCRERMLRKRNKDLICFLNIGDQNNVENYFKIFEELRESGYLAKTILIVDDFVEKQYKNTYVPAKIIKTDFAIVNFNKNNKRVLIFNNSSNNTIYILSLLSKIWIGIKNQYEIYNIDIDYSILHLLKKLKESIILADFNYNGDYSLDFIKEEFMILANHLEDSSYLKEEVKNMLEHSINEKPDNLFDFIISQVDKYGYENIYISNSRFYLSGLKKKDFTNKLKNKFSEIDLKVNIYELNKHFPVSVINSEKSLLINLGQDKESLYFILKLDCLFVTDIYGYDYINRFHIRSDTHTSSKFELILNKGKEYLSKLVSQYYLNKEHIRGIIKEMNIDKYNDFNMKINVRNQKTKELLVINGNKKIYYTIGDSKIYMEDSLQNLVESGITEIKTFCIENLPEIKNIWHTVENIVYQKNNEKRKDIKNSAALFIYKKYKNINKNDYYEKLSEDLKKIYRNNKYHDFSLADENLINGINLKSWVEGDTLPSKIYIFKSFLELIKYKGDFDNMWTFIKKETAQSIKTGKQSSNELEKILKDGFLIEKFNDKEIFDVLMNEILEKGLSEMYSLEKELVKENKDE